MSHPHEHHIHIFVNQARVEFDHPRQTGRSIKERAGIPECDALYLETVKEHDNLHASTPHEAHASEGPVEVEDDQVITLHEGQHFISRPKITHIHIWINRTEYIFENAVQTGATIKERAGIPLSDVLFLDRPHEDEVIPNELTITLKCGERFHTEPPANYGNLVVDEVAVGHQRFEVIPQPDGWTFLLLHDYNLPEGFTPRAVQLLVKLPPLFPEAAPDMFWVSPHVESPNGSAPQGTSTEELLGRPWQRFSWHLSPGAWTPGISTLRDFMRCVRARFERRN